MMRTFLLSLLAIFGIASSAVAELYVGDGTGGVFIKKVEYSTLAEAVAAINAGTAEGDTIKLMRDVSEPSIEITAPMTIDFNGHHYHVILTKENKQPLTVNLGLDVTLKNGYIALSGTYATPGVINSTGNLTLDNMIVDGKHNGYWIEAAKENIPWAATCVFFAGKNVIKGNSRILAAEGANAISFLPLMDAESQIDLIKNATQLQITGKNVVVTGALNLFTFLGLGEDFDDLNEIMVQLLRFYSRIVIPASMEIELSENTQKESFAWAKVGSNKELVYTVTLPEDISSGYKIPAGLLNAEHIDVPSTDIKVSFKGLPSGVKLVKIKGTDETPETYELQGEFKKAGPFTAVMTASQTVTFEDKEGVEKPFTITRLTQVIGNITDFDITTSLNDPCTEEDYPSPNKISVTKGPYTIGKTIKLKASPAAGYKFDTWKRYNYKTESYEGVALETAEFSFDLTEKAPRAFRMDASFSLRDEIGALFAAPAVEGDKNWNTDKVITLKPGQPVEIPLDETIAETLTIKGLPSGLKLGTTVEGKPAIVGTPKKAKSASTLVFTQKSAVKGEDPKVSGRLLVVAPYDRIYSMTVLQNGEPVDKILNHGRYLVASVSRETIDPITITYNTPPTKLEAKDLPKGLKLSYDKKTAIGTLTGSITTPGYYEAIITATGPDGNTLPARFYFNVSHLREIKIPGIEDDEGNKLDEIRVTMTPTKGVIVPDDGFTALNAWLTENPTAKIKGLPSGMKVTKNKESGTLAITGTPKKGGTYSLTITLKGDDGITRTTTIDLYVNAELKISAIRDKFHVAYGEKSMIPLFEFSPDATAPTWGILNTNLGITFPDGSKVGYLPQLKNADATTEDDQAPINLAEYIVKVEGLPKGMKLEKRVYTLTHTDTPKEKMTTYVITGTPKVAENEWHNSTYSSYFTDKEYDCRYAWCSLPVTLTHKATGATGSFICYFSIEDYLAEHYKGTYILEGTAADVTDPDNPTPWPIRVVIDRPTGFGGTATVYVVTSLAEDEKSNWVWQKVATLPFAYNDNFFMDEDYTDYTAWYAKGKNRIAFYRNFLADDKWIDGYDHGTVIIENLEFKGKKFSSQLIDEGKPVWEEEAMLDPFGYRPL